MVATMKQDRAFVSVPKKQYMILKSIYRHSQKQLELARMMEVENNLQNGDYTTHSSEDFMAQI